MQTIRAVSLSSLSHKRVERAVAWRLNEHADCTLQKETFDGDCNVARLVWLRNGSWRKESHVASSICLLDMSAAFDCVDHDTLLRRLRLRYGLAGDDVINWFSLFLTGRAQQVAYNGTMSTIQPVMLFGEPHVRFRTRTARVRVIHRGVVERHDTMLHHAVRRRLSELCQRFSCWLTRCRFQVISVHHRSQPVDECQPITDCVSTRSKRKSCGSVLASISQRSDQRHIIPGDNFVQSQQFRCSVRQYTVRRSIEIVGPCAHIISPGLFCNSLMYGIADGLLEKLQSIQISAARLVTGTRRRDHKFKVACLAFKSLAHQVAEYLSSDYRLVSIDHFDRRTQEPASFHERTTVMGIAVSLCPALSNGTLYQQNFDNHASNSNTSSASWKLLCLQRSRRLVTCWYKCL